jgi:hypothetical protein
MEMGEIFYRRMFLIGSLWNILGGILIIVFGNWIFATANLAFPDPPVYFYSWIALFMVFGIGYFMVYRDMYGNKNIVILGILGKLAFSAIFVVGMIAFRGQTPAAFLIAVVGDLIFVVLFCMFLSLAREAGR